MKTFLISYDLNQALDRNVYDSLIEHIRTKYLFWAKPLESLWLIKTEDNSTQIINDILPFVRQQDKILVVEVTNDWMSYNLSADVIDWMKAGL